MILYFLSNGKICCRARVCSCKLLFPNLGNKHHYNGMALLCQIKEIVNRLIQPHWRRIDRNR
jgi:hypothetical protein